MKRPLWICGLRAMSLGILVVGAQCGHAAGLGSLRVSSAIGQPLLATISLSGDDTNAHESSCVKARLDETDGSFISVARASITRSQNSSIITISTRHSLNDPAATLTVQIGCNTPVHRSYQILLDPAGALAKSAQSSSLQLQEVQSTPARLYASVASPMTTTAAAAEKEALPKKSSRPSLAAQSTSQLPASPAVKSAPAKDARKRLALSADNTDIAASHLSSGMKLTEGLSDSGSLGEGQKTEEWRIAKVKFAAILNGDNASETSEKSMRLAQDQLMQVQAATDALRKQSQTEKMSQDDIQKKLIPANWITALTGLIIALLLGLAWLVWRLAGHQKAQEPDALKNFLSADSIQAETSNIFHTLSRTEYPTLSLDTHHTIDFDALYADHNTEQLIDTIKPSEVHTEKQVVVDTLAKPQKASAPAINKAEAEAEAKAEVKAEVKAEIKARQPSQLMTKPEAAHAHADEKPADAHKIAELPKVPTPPPQQVAPKNTAAAIPTPALTTTKSADIKIDLPAQAIAAATSVAPSSTSLAHKEKPRALKAEEISDVMQQAEFWMLLQDPVRAIEILEPYRDIEHPTSPVPWLYLLDLYRMVGDQEQYEALIARIKKIFNAKIPKWDGQFGITPRTLNDFPHIVEMICDLWDGDRIVPYLEGLLIDTREGAREGFDLPVYRDIVQLITLASDPEQSQQHDQERFEKAQSILFSQQASKPAAPKADMTDWPNVDAALTSSAQKSPDAVPPLPASPDAIVAVLTPDLAVPEIHFDTVNTAVVTTADNETVEAEATDVAPAPITPTTHTPAELPVDQTLLAPESAPQIVSNYDNTDEMDNKLELAIAYQEIGEKDGARELLNEVIKAGSKEQSAKAKSMLESLA